MIQGLYEKDLNRLGFGEHMAHLRDWNEEVEFIFGPATMVVMASHTFLMHEDNLGGLITAVYQNDDKRDLVSLRIYTDNSPYGDEYFKTMKG